jgi:hypothetical protein
MIQKRIIRVIMNSRNRDTCHALFKKLNTLSLKSRCIFSLLVFVVRNRELCKSYSDIRNINTGYSSDSDHPISILTTFQKGAYYCGINVFNYLPPALRFYLMN